MLTVVYLLFVFNIVWSNVMNDYLLHLPVICHKIIHMYHGKHFAQLKVTMSFINVQKPKIT